MACQKAFDGSLGGLSQQGLELGEELLDRIEIGTVGRKVEQLGADRLDESAYPRPLVAGEIVHDHDVARPQSGSEELLSSRRSAPSCSTFRPTVPISIRSRSSSPSSRPCCERPPSEPSKAFGKPSANASTTSLHANAQTTSLHPDTNQREQKAL